LGERRDIGLKAIDEARAERGRSKVGRISGPVWLIAGGAVLLTVLGAWLYKNRSLSGGQEQLLAQQRAVIKTVGAEWYPLRDRLESLTVEAAGEYKGDLVEPQAAQWDFRSAPGIYLRLRVEDAKSVESIRKRARESAKDAFTACLLREKNPSTAARARGEDAGTGWQDQPWNLRLGYTATYILSDEWAEEVRSTKEELDLRVYVQQYENAKAREIPLVVDIVKRAQFYLFLLDEDVPEAKGDGGKITEETLQAVGHPTRVHIVDLKSGKVMVRLRRETEGEFRFAGERAVRDPAVLAAMQRQVNNCALAQEVWAAIKPGDAESGKDAVKDAGSVEAP
jgi:hypothetical protein